MTPDDFAVFTGSAVSFLPALSIGASGCIVSLASLFPHACIKIKELFDKGELEEARKLQIKINSIAKAITAKYGITGLKTALDLTGYFGGEPRSPLCRSNNKIKEEMKSLLKKFHDKTEKNLLSLKNS